tara:strand:+ start:820 stop:1263 length:444 start_codon:yes stop_codon:yes gene_type:complete
MAFIGNGWSPILPLRHSVDGGYATLVTISDVALQNFRMLMLTTPESRVMLPEFGVGLKTYLFEKNHHTTYSEIETKIRSQTSRYLPYFDILSIDFKDSFEDEGLLSIQIDLFIRPTREAIRFVFDPSSEEPLVLDLIATAHENYVRR